MPAPSFEILRQGDWDVWSSVCLAVSALLLAWAARHKPWQSRGGWRSSGLIVAGVAGTIAVLALPQLRTPVVGMASTFALLAICSTVFYLPWTARLGRRRTGALLVLRVCALAALVPMLFEPALTFSRPRRPERPVLFLLDTSGSMSFPDVQNGPSRLQSVREALQPLLPRLRETLVPRFFAFSTDLAELTSTDDLARLTADGKATDLAAAIERADARRGRDDAAIVVLSDGIDNASAGDVAEAAAKLGRPVYAVLVGSDAAEATPVVNVAVTDVAADEELPVGHESRVTATIASSALPNRVVQVNLAELDAAGKPSGPRASVELVLRATPGGQTVALPYKPARVGPHRLAVWVDPVPGEQNVADNRQELQVVAVDPTIKVLYVEGRLRPEYREIKRLLERDPNVELATLLWLTPTKVTAFGTNDRKPLAARLPATTEEWKRFDVVILGDVGTELLAPAQQAQLEQFVADGGGLLMLGGDRTFGAGGYAGTPIERALPVFAGGGAGAPDVEPFVPRLTADGAAHPAMDGLAEWFGAGDKPPERPLPPLHGNVLVGAEKAGAQALLVRPGRANPDGRPQTVLAVQRYGAGRSAALTVYSTYQWALPLYGLGQDSPFNRLWGQLVRWLANADVRNRRRGPGVDALLAKSVFTLGEPIRVRALVRDARGDATRYAQVALTLRRPGSPQPQHLPLGPVEGRPGAYDLTLPHLPPGDYASSLAAAKDGRELGRQDVAFTVIAPATELTNVAANRALMRAIAERTHGGFYELSRLPELVEELVRTDTRTPQIEHVTIRLANFVTAVPALFGRRPDLPRRYDLPMQAALVVMLLAGEWALRRWWQVE